MTAPRTAVLGAATVLLLTAMLAACAPADGGDAGPSSSPTIPGTSAPTDPDAIADPTPSPGVTTVVIAIPTDCREILSDDVLAQLEDVPLNDPAFGPSGVLPDGTLKCIWADPAADTTGLTTTISRMYRGPALDMLNDLAANEDFSCYTPDGGTRCEASWPNETYPVTDGRTLFWRDDVMIDTTYSNLAPLGYTSSIVDSIWV